MCHVSVFSKHSLFIISIDQRACDKYITNCISYHYTSVYIHMYLNNPETFDFNE